MQDRYAGDVGDFGKFKLLQELQREGFTLGVNWYRAEPPASEKDPKTGKFLWQDGKYRIRPQDRQLDPKLADGKQAFALTCCRGTLRDYLIIAATAEDAAGIRQALQRIVQSPWGTTGFCRQSAFPDLDSVERKENPD